MNFCRMYSSMKNLLVPVRKMAPGLVRFSPRLLAVVMMSVSGRAREGRLVIVGPCRRVRSGADEPLDEPPVTLESLLSAVPEPPPPALSSSCTPLADFM